MEKEPTFSPFGPNCSASAFLLGLEMEVLGLVFDSVRNILRTLEVTEPRTSVRRLKYFLQSLGV